MRINVKIPPRYKDHQPDKGHEPSPSIPGDKMPDGSVYVGLAADGTQQIYATPANLSTTMRFNDAAKTVEKLNSDKYLGHDDWRLPSLDDLRILNTHQNEGALKDTFKSARGGNGADFPDWYWSSEESNSYPADPLVFHLSGAGQISGCDSEELLSCRPVRLVTVTGSSRN